MARYIIHPKTGELVNSEDYFLEKYFEKDHLRMTVGNRKVHLNYISDQMEPTRHMASGKYFTSKKKFRDETKAYGCVEIGNETKYLNKRKPAKLDRKKRREDIKKAINDLKYGNVPRQIV